jgi:hypothetical protein
MAEGLREDVQNPALRSKETVRLVEIRRLLGAVSLAGWYALVELWHRPARTARKQVREGSLPDDA